MFFVSARSLIFHHRQHNIDELIYFTIVQHFLENNNIFISHSSVQLKM